MIVLALLRLGDWTPNLGANQKWGDVGTTAPIKLLHSPNQ